MRRTIFILSAIAATIISYFATAAASNASVIDRKCSNFVYQGSDWARACIQQTNLNQFNSVVEVMFVDDSATVYSNLEQCRGDGTNCAVLQHLYENPGSGHWFIATPLQAGSHGHSYRSNSEVGVFYLESPFIAYS
jgi:hypothetical protein